MPVYSFVCPVCGSHFEQRMSFQADNHNIHCPNGHDGVRRVFSVPSVVFKGSGFYVTDSRKQPAKASGND